MFGLFQRCSPRGEDIKLGAVLENRERHCPCGVCTHQFPNHLPINDATLSKDDISTVSISATDSHNVIVILTDAIQPWNARAKRHNETKDAAKPFRSQDISSSEDGKGFLHLAGLLFSYE